MRKAFQDKARQQIAKILVDINTLAVISKQAVSSLSNTSVMLDEASKLLKSWVKSDSKRTAEKQESA